LIGGAFLATALLLAAPASEAKPAPWKEVFALPKSNDGRFFVAVWGDEKGAVVAVGNGLLVQGQVGGAFTATELPPRHALYAVWGKGAEDLFAVGPRQLIMHFADHKWVTERPQQEGNPRQLLLYEVGPFFPDTIAAYGPGAGEDGLKRIAGNWVPLTPREVTEIRRREGMQDLGNKPCRADSQRRRVTPEGTAWVVCNDRSVFLQQGQAFQPRGRLPAHCRGGIQIHGSAIWQADLILNCNGEVWRNHGTEWEHDSIPDRVEALYATPACLYAVTKRSILARC